MRNIIIEGTDGVGKTTLAKNLASAYGYNYFHSSSKTPNDYQYHFSLLDSDDKVVLDRFHIGELIYPILFDRDSKLTVESATMLSRMDDTLTIILYSSSDEFIINRIVERGDAEDMKVVIAANKMFQMIGQFLELLGVEVMMIDVSNENLIQKVVEKINV